jgi:DNA-binding MarR family transcriptional regulator
MTACGCQYDEYEIRTEFCRPCAMNLEQGSDEWKRARLGKLTASRISDALAKNRQGTGPGITRLNYQAEIICERLNGFAYEGFHSIYTERGKEEEESAVKAYDLFVTPAWTKKNRLEVKPIGFVQHASIPYFGASPDRAVGAVGLLEVKNRKTNIHFDLLRSLKVPTGDVDQVLTELACAEWAEWCDYVSYDSRAPVGMDLFVRRFYREDHRQRIAEIEQRGQEFLAEVERLAADLQERALSGFIFLEREAQQNGSDFTKQLTSSLDMLKPDSVVVPIKTRRRRTAVEA